MGYSHDVVKLALIRLSVAPETGVVDANSLATSSSGGVHLGSSLVHAHSHAAEGEQTNEDDASDDGGNKGTGVSFALFLGVVEEGSGELRSSLVVEGGRLSVCSRGLGLGGGSGISSLLAVDLGDSNVDDLEVLTVLLGAVDTVNISLTSRGSNLSNKIVDNDVAVGGHGA